MTHLQPFQILPPFKDDSTFEEFIADYFNEIEQTQSYARYGRNGQNQSGMDVVSYEKTTAIQCKLRSIGNSSNTSIRKDLIKELHKDFESFYRYKNEKDLSFNKFILASSFLSDTGIDDECFSLSKEYNIDVQYWSWEKLMSSIPENVIQKYFGSLLKNAQKYFQWNDSQINSVDFDIKELDRIKFIGSINYTPHHIDRTFRKAQHFEEFYWNKEIYTFNEDSLLSESEYGIMVLGNPGSGKTTELKRIALDGWENRNERNKVPFYTSLKNFNSSSTIINLLPIEYKRIPYLIIVLDGLDEVYDIVDFSNKLRSFIDELSTNNTNNNTIKFVISCRTSIYNKIVKDLTGFNTVYLNPVIDGQAISFLANKYNIDFVKRHRDFNFLKYHDLLESPFYLELIGNNYLKHEKLEISRSKLIAQYIENRLIEDESDKFRNHIYSSGEYLISAKTLAFAMEIMQMSAFEDSKARAFIKDTNILTKNPFIEQSIDKKWSFELKNIQEYFVADILSKMEFGELLTLIKIDGHLNKIHPSWHNVVTLLLNIEFENQSTYDELVSWLIENDIEMIFQGDAELVSDTIRNTSLQRYFEIHCIEKTLWISNRETVGKFGDTQVNIDYLFDKALDTNVNIRARLTAISLLNNMSLATVSNTNNIAALLTQIMSEFQSYNEDFLHLMDETLSLVHRAEKVKKNALLKNTTKFVAKYDYKEFVHTVVSQIDANNFSEHQDFIMDILKKCINEKPWTYSSKYASVVSTKEQIFNIFTSIKDTNNLLTIFDFISKWLRNDKLREKYIEQFITHCGATIKLTETNARERLIDIILDVITTDKIYHMEEHLISDLTKKCLINEEIFKTLLSVETEKNSNLYFIALIMHEDWFNHIVDYYNNGTLKDSFIIRMRSRLSYPNVSSAVKFEEYIESNSSFKFNDRIEDSNKLAIEKYEFQNNSAQREFDVKFDVALIRVQMENIFNYYELEELCYADIDKFWKKYYDDFELQKSISQYAKIFLSKFLRQGYSNGLKLTINELDKIIVEHDLSRIESIFQALPKNEETGIQVSDVQQQLLKEWVFSNKHVVDRFLKDPSIDLSTTENKTIYLFLELLRYFKFTGFSEDFLIALIDFSSYSRSFDFNFIADFIGREKVKEKVLIKLSTDETPQTKIQLLEYLHAQEIPFDKGLYGIKEDVKNAILAKNYDYAKQLLKLFYLNDSSFLKELAYLYLDKYEDYYLLPFILNELLTLREHDFVKNFLTRNHELLIKRNLLEEAQIIKYLVKSNGELAFELLKNIVFNTKSDGGDTYYNDDYGSFTNPDAIEDLIAIAKYSLSLTDYDAVFNGYFKPHTMVTRALVSIGQKSNLITCEHILHEIKNIIPVSDEKQNNRFHHENLLNEIHSVIYKHQSKPFTIQQAIEFNESNMYLFY
ncbi:NACHT domain-containing protein [Sphingobacterium sp. MYb388]|uniref:NACHT domain-containing protein n=1 Tax=Sphingobacterium sp. MYb388 TaxID=2745437 RepID=UPI0030A4A7AA